MMTTGTPQKISDLRTTERVLVNRNRVCEWVWRSAATEKRTSMRDEWTRRVMLWDGIEIFWGGAEGIISYTTHHHHHHHHHHHLLLLLHHHHHHHLHPHLHLYLHLHLISLLYFLQMSAYYHFLYLSISMGDKQLYQYRSGISNQWWRMLRRSEHVKSKMYSAAIYLFIYSFFIQH